MAKAVVPGFLLAGSNVTGGPWSVLAGGRDVSGAAQVEGWDPSIDLMVSRPLEVDLPGLLAATGQGQGARFRSVLMWHATGSGLRGVSESVPAVDGVVHLQLDLEGAVLGGTLTVESVVILDLPDPGHPLAATAAGVVVWREQTSYTLEGDGNRLQTQQLSFSEQGLGLPAAAWRLHVEEEAGLDDLAGAQVFLYLNSDHPRLTSLLEGDAPDPLLLSALRLEMERRLVEAALDRFEELETRSTYDEGSFGEALDRALKRNFPGQSPAEIAAQRDRDRGWFEMTLQARTRFLA